MKTLKIVGMVALLLVVAVFSCSCDSDQDMPGNPVDIVGDHDSGDKPDATESPPGDDVWIDEDDVEETDAGLDLFELCGGFINTWDCICTEGVCEGQFSILEITLFEILEHQHTFWVRNIYPNDGGQYPFVCDGYPPAETGTGGVFYQKDGELTKHFNSSHGSTLSYTLECVPHSTD